MPTAPRCGSYQSSPVISRPDGCSQARSLGPPPDRRAALEPVPLPQRRVLPSQPQGGLGRARRRRATASSGRQSIHDVSLSWQYALLLPPCVRPRSSPAVIIGTPLDRQQGRHQVRGLAAPQREHLRVVGLALDAVVPRPVVVGAVAVVLAVGLVVLVVVGDQVAQGEPVVGGDEVDRGVRRAPVVGYRSERAGQPGRDGRGSPVGGRARSRASCRGTGRSTRSTAAGSSPTRYPSIEVSHGSAISFTCRSIGSCPIVVSRSQPMSSRWSLPGQRRQQVEAEAVDVHLGDPVPQRVEDQPERHRESSVDRVAAAGDVPVDVVERLAEIVVADPAVEARSSSPRKDSVGPSGAGLGGVVVDDVEQDLDAGLVERLDHRLELGDLLTAVTGGGVARCAARRSRACCSPSS